ncbi:MAG: lipid II flippase MurJ [Cytophagales bacterium]|nr:lipid II flippase MurJ [Cytophagales bacterium]
MWQATVPMIGAAINLIVLLVFARSLGVIGLAIATTCGIIVQVLLLLRIINKGGQYKFDLGWKEDGVYQILRLSIPLLLVAIVTKFTPILDRYLGSELQVGSISHLNYAFKLIAIFSVLISTGGATVIFPKMALDASNNDLIALRNTMSFGLRMMWLILAPVISIGVSLALPLIIILFNRGEFTMFDSQEVAALLQIYLIGLIGMSLTNVTGKIFYALKDTKTLAIFGTIEALAYAAYTIYLTKWLGIVGIAVGYVIYFNISLLWQTIVVKRKVGGSGQIILKSFMKTIIAAIGGGLCTYFSVHLVSTPVLKVLVGSLTGLGTYMSLLFIVGSNEIKVVISILSPYLRKSDS